MSRKSYLADQYKLMSLKTSDLFTEEESKLFNSILTIKQDIEKAEDKAEKKRLTDLKKQTNEQLKALIRTHAGTPRIVNIKAVCDTRYYSEDKTYIDWDELKLSRQIQEFCSEFSRCAGIKINEVSYDKIIIAWKSIDVLEQIVKDGFYLPLKTGPKKFMFFTASAGQLRRDKIQCVSEEVFNRIYNQLFAGLTFDKINEHVDKKGYRGINVNKLSAYMGLPCSATERWDCEDGSKFSIRHCLVIPDFEAPVVGRMEYIKRNWDEGHEGELEHEFYTNTKAIQEVMINHCDGIGMKLPIVDKVSRVKSKNDMIRSAWIKGLLTEFDYIAFCHEKGVPAIIKDVWGKAHDLEKEEIWVLMTDSQLKLAKYYKSWEEYCTMWEENDCWLCRTNYDEVDYEHNWLDYSPINYQLLQALVCMTPEEKEAAIVESRQKIINLATTKEAMLQTMGCDKPKTALQRCLKMYPALLRDGYCRQSIKDKKKLMTLNAKSGVLHCKNRRVYAIPDMYAACEYWFQHIEKPEGLLKDGEVYCMLNKDGQRLDILRNPSLYMEHAVRTNKVSPEIKKWFKTGGVYTSCHDLISRILQFDVDGDMLNLCEEEWMINAALRTIEHYDVVPLFYDAIKAYPEEVTRANQFHGLKRAHENSGIGQISNDLTKLWNQSGTPDFRAAGWITYMNNRVIDAAKTGDECKYPAKEKEIIDKATGGAKGKMPYFFQFSKNGRRADGTPGTKCAALNNSTMNDLCALVNGKDDDGNIKKDINMNFRNIDPFNYRMFMKKTERYFNVEVRQIFLDEIIRVQSGLIPDAEVETDEFIVSVGQKNELACDKIKTEIMKICDLEDAYETIVVDMYAGKNLDKVSYKNFFWMIFGDIAEENLKENLKNCHKCPICGQLVPNWDNDHQHQGEDEMHYRCYDCNKIFEFNNFKNNSKNKRNEKSKVQDVKRCQKCYEVFRQQMKNAARKAAREKKAELEYKKMIAERAEIIQKEIEQCGYSNI